MNKGIKYHEDYNIVQKYHKIEVFFEKNLSFWKTVEKELEVFMQ